MAFTPISNTVPQYEENGVAASGYFIKFYESGTTTPTAMATDSTGTTLLDKCELNTEGYPINGSGAVFIPHINVEYKIALFRNAADADANDLNNAAWDIDGLFPYFTDSSIGTAFNQIPLNADIVYPVANVTDLRLLKPVSNGQQISLLGHTLPGIGGDPFYYDPDDTSSPDNNGTVIVNDWGDRWKRLKYNPVIDSACWGVDPSINSEASLLKAAEYAGTREVYIKEGAYNFGSVNFSDYNFISNGLVTSDNITVSVTRLENKFHLSIPTSKSYAALAEGTQPIIDMNYDAVSFRDRGKTVGVEHLTRTGEVDYLDRPIASRATDNLAADPTLSGAVVGNLNSGGSLPTGWDRSIPQVDTEILEVGPNTMTVRCQRVGTTEPVTSLRSYITMPSSLTHSKCVSQADVEILDATGAAVGVSLHTVSSAGFRPSVTATDKAHLRISTVVSPDEDVQLRITFLANSGDYSLTAKISNVMMEQSDSINDINPFTASSALSKSCSVYNKLRGTIVGFTDKDVITTNENTLSISGEGVVLNRVVCTKQANLDYFLMGASKFDWASAAASNVTYNNTLVGVQSVSAPHSIQMLPYNQDIIRFEVRDGERASFDVASVDRCEVLASPSELVKGVDHWYSVHFYVEEGMPIESSFSSIFQIHGGTASPIFSFDVSDDVLKIIYGSSNSVFAGSGNRIPFTINVCKLERETIYNAVVKVNIVDPSSGMGFLGVWVNGVEVINAPTYLGYDGFTPYAKLGLYRANSKHNQSVVYSKFSFSGESMQDKIDNPDNFFSVAI